VRFSLPLSLAGLAAIFSFFLVGAALAKTQVRPDQPAPVKAMRGVIDHYRTLTWTYERAARVGRTRSAFSDRHSTDRAYLQWTIDAWTARAYHARALALARIQRRLSVPLPHAPALHARLARRLSYSRTLTLRLRHIYPGTVTRRYAAAAAATAKATLRLWQARSAFAALQVARHGPARPAVPGWLVSAFLCIHRYEGGWGSNTGNGYYGGLQMDLGFQRSYGGDYLARFGTADNWPPAAQIEVAARAYEAGRGFGPWPNTARACGLA
jgi:Transglycosylase-like domain